MTKKAFDKIAEGLQDAVAIARGEAEPGTFRIHEPPEDIDVRAIRKNLGLTQDEFASRFGFSRAAVRDWEQGRKRPDRTTRSYLLVIKHRPDTVNEAFREEHLLRMA